MSHTTHNLADSPRRATSDQVAAIPIVMASDEAYAMQLATTLRSIVEAHRGGRPIQVHVLSNGIADATRAMILDSLPAGSVSIRWIPVGLEMETFAGFSRPAHISDTTYARLLIPRVLPDTVARVLYLDSDLLVLDDLSGLAEVDLEGAVIGAVLDNLDARIKADTPGFELWPRVGAYFNAGVLLIDLPLWKAEGISEKALEYLVRNPSSPVCDQDALNVACDGRWKSLDPRWNYQDHYDKVFATMHRQQWPGIVHFVTTLKPWKPDVCSLNAGFYNEFRSRTRFPRTPVESVWGVLFRIRRFFGKYSFLRTIRDSFRAEAHNGL